MHSQFALSYCLPDGYDGCFYYIEDTKHTNARGTYPNRSLNSTYMNPSLERLLLENIIMTQSGLCATRSPVRPFPTVQE